MKKTLVIAALAALTACTNTEIFDAAAIENNLKSTYTENFKKAYPDIDLNQSWDFSLKQTSFSLPQTSIAAARTRAAAYTMTKGDAYEIDNGTLTWMKNKLVEKKNNKSLGQPFYMHAPANSFTIVPIFQGEAALIWELHMVVDGVDFKIWEKSEDMWVKKTANDTEWTAVGTLATSKETQNNTIGKAAVKSPTYTFSNLPVGAEIYFYLKVTDDKDANKMHKASIGAEQSSLDHMMLALDDCPAPTNLPEGNEVMIIGCEDLKINSDWDMNDLVFMIYGKPEVPKPVIIQEGDPVLLKKTVRYMIEDLGATDDFDFNDIVLDVSEIRTATPVYTNGVLSSWKEDESQYRQEAVIRHLGGTLPFKLKIGDTQLEEHRGILGANPDEVFAVSGWDINAHNISVQVQQMNNAGVYNNLSFPKAGEAPMIIAVEPTTEWMNERQSVPAAWFYIPGNTEE